MTKSEVNLCLKAVLDILQGYSKNPKDIIEYLYTDVAMQINTDLEDIRTKSFPLSMSGVKEPVDYKQNKNVRTGLTYDTRKCSHHAGAECDNCGSRY